MRFFRPLRQPEGFGLLAFRQTQAAAYTIDLEARLQGVAAASRDYQEGVAAFLEKRKPKFEGK